MGIVLADLPIFSHSPHKHRLCIMGKFNLILHLIVFVYIAKKKIALLSIEKVNILCMYISKEPKKGVVIITVISNIWLVGGEENCEEKNY